ncbi:hypothetical protein K3N28_19080 [Glycomyces sp. TRM65418]|uniref:hypothetical protein n=1 Tax=Glycomyces sp. TRM65418 TaxID=2867006 RepID=UPI001CE4F860|nr:hypothetical protein [Glycomyces sp. TRM65418]MCC3765165.1 hypothetical protein [Glycomyces sp. TRM65418]QZD54791.1 hypothetical protein K3N28_18985 [Glycomyces sp. TRM65418]
MIRKFTRTLVLLAASVFVVVGTMAPANAGETTGSPETELLNIGGYSDNYRGHHDVGNRIYCRDYKDGLLDGLLDGFLGRDYCDYYYDYPGHHRGGH